MQTCNIIMLVGVKMYITCVYDRCNSALGTYPYTKRTQ